MSNVDACLSLEELVFVQLEVGGRYLLLFIKYSQGTIGSTSTGNRGLLSSVKDQSNLCKGTNPEWI